MIDVERVSVELGGASILEDLSCRVDRGELVGLVGPNGAGKTTLVRTVNGIVDPDEGRVRLDGEPVADLSSRAVSRRVATVPQTTHLGFAFTAEAVVEMGRTPHRSRLDWSDDRDPVAAAMARTETTHLRDRSVADLSGGERQRVLLARALAQEAPAVVLDEPTASLDVNHQIRVLEIVRDLVDEGRAALAAIHDLDLAARFCDRLLLLHEGRIRAAGSPADVLAAEDLDAAFRTTTAVREDPVTGSPGVTPVGEREDRALAVHVVGAGRPAARAVGALWRAGFDPSLGPVPDGDVAAELADGLGLDVVRTRPFAEPADAAVDAAESLATSADVLLAVDGPAARSMAAVLERHPTVVRAGEIGGRTDHVRTTGAQAPDEVELVRRVVSGEVATAPVGDD